MTTTALSSCNDTNRTNTTSSFLRTFFLFAALLALCQRVSGQRPIPLGSNHSNHNHNRQSTGGSPPQSHPNTTAGGGEDEELICVPAGQCEPCPADLVRHTSSSYACTCTDATTIFNQLHEPFCQPFGTRRLMHCTPPSSSSASSTSDHSSTSNTQPRQHDSNPSTTFQTHSRGIPGFEPCGRITSLERYDFYEFVAFNLGLGILAVGGVVFRSRLMRARQVRTIAARIGLGGPASAGPAAAGAAAPGGWRALVGGES